MANGWVYFGTTWSRLLADQRAGHGLLPTLGYHCRLTKTKGHQLSRREDSGLRETGLQKAKDMGESKKPSPRAVKD